MNDSSGKETVKFYFSFNDPYSFIATPAVKNLAQNYKIEIEHSPLASFDKSGVFSEDESVRSYYRADIERLSQKAGRKLNYIDRAQDSVKVCRGLCLANEKMLGLKFINLVFAMRWVNGGDISDTSDVIESLKFLEFDETELRQALESDQFTPRLDALETEAKNDGVIATPFYFFKGMGYLGVERIEYLEEDIKSDPSLTIHHDAGYIVTQPDELKKMMEDKSHLLVLDIRIPKDFGKAHIPGSNCIPSKVVHRHVNDLDRDWPIVLVDDGGVAASEIGFFLASEGFKKISVLAGGFPAWKGATQSGLENWRDKLKSARAG
ncbi:hypothetical protein MNBD_NITROSPINAE04-185 [hydrothermal vent metagenome]|uniref:Rhodanese domain-containing protein n=1 Tax=hydrothermal vent metagenome TaxID=652676 RepID=A0A3B1CF87_9ZZZZ